MRSISSGRRTPIGVADHGLPDRVEADVAADVDREPGAAERLHLLREVERPAAVGVEDLGGHALRQHVDGGRQRVGRRVTVDVDEAGRDEQPARVDLVGRGARRQVANRDDEAVANRRCRRRSADCRCRR